MTRSPLRCSERSQLRALALLVTLLPPAFGRSLEAAQAGTVVAEQKVSDTAGGFEGLLEDLDLFGSSATCIGDLDGDGVPDLAVGAEVDDDGGFGRGAVWILFMNADGTVASEQKISDTQGGLGPGLEDTDLFGCSVVSLGDLDGDGVQDLAVGALGDVDAKGDVSGFERGAVWILFMNPDGTVAGKQKISDKLGGFAGLLDDFDWFGSSLAAPGDLDGDGVADLAVGAQGDSDAGTSRGAVWILFLNADGTVKGQRKINGQQGGLVGPLENDDLFGYGAAAIGDLDGDGTPDLAVGARGDDGSAGGQSRGAVWILFMNPDGTVAGEQRIADGEGGFGGVLEDFDYLGSSVVALGDVDGDGVVDLASGAYGDDGGGISRGAVWVLFLNPDGTVAAEQKIGAGEGGLVGPLLDGVEFGSSVAAPGDLDGDGTPDLVAGAQRDGDGGDGRGAVWVLFLEGAPAPPVAYCTAGTSASGCQALLAASGAPSATAASGFVLSSTGVEGAKDGLFFFGVNGRQANPWGNGTSFQCVAPPVARAGLLPGAGTPGACDGVLAQDLNALWCPACPKPGKNPGAGALVQAQLWYRDPQSTSNQTTSLSDALEFQLAP